MVCVSNRKFVDIFVAFIFSGQIESFFLIRLNQSYLGTILKLINLNQAFHISELH